MGSKNDLPKLEGCISTLQALGVPHVVRVMSAHRTPEAVAAFVTSARESGLGSLSRRPEARRIWPASARRTRCCR